MNDPSFILKGSSARELRDFALDLQALVDARSAAIAQPITVTHISPALSDAPQSATEAERTVDDTPAPAGHRVGAGSTSIIPFLAKSLAAKLADHRG